MARFQMEQLCLISVSRLEQGNNDIKGPDCFIYWNSNIMKNIHLIWASMASINLAKTTARQDEKN